MLLSCYYQSETLRNADKEKSHKIGVLPNFTGCKNRCFLSLNERLAAGKFDPQHPAAEIIVKLIDYAYILFIG